MQRDEQLDRLIAPCSVAVVGASPRAGGWGLTTIENLAAVGFQGQVYPVNPRHDSIAGRPCFPDLASLPSVPDVAVVAVPAAAVPDTIEAAQAAGIPAAVVYASGFGVSGQGEGGDPGADGPRARLIQATAGRRIAVLGPNCLGAVNYARRAAMWGITMPTAHAGAESGVALVAQSGNIALTLAMTNRGFAITHLLSCGNQLDATAAELLHACLRDPAVRTLAAVIEGVRDIPRFREVLEAAAEQDVPVVVLKVGQSARGQAATIAHTGTLSGEPALYHGLFRQYGVVEVTDLDEMVAACALLSGATRTHARAVAFFASSGGECGVVSDLSHELAVPVPELPPDVAGTLQSLLPDYGRVSNPLDFTATGWGNAELYGNIIAAFAAVPEVDTIVGVHDAPTLEGDDLEEHWQGIVDGLEQGTDRVRALRPADPPVIANLTTIGDVRSSIPRALSAAGVVPLSGLRPALSALGKICGRSAWSDARAGSPAAPPPVDATARRQVADLLGARLGPVSEHIGKQVLAAYGIAVPASRLVHTPEAAVAAARAIGFPVVAKVAWAAITHKTEAGGVLLGLRSDSEVAAAAEKLLALLRAHDADDGAGVLIEELVAARTEIIVGARRDASFGPIVMVGIGGVHAELLNDVTHRLAPVTTGEAERMLDELQLSGLLNGPRGAPPVDRASVARVVSAVSRLIRDCESVGELDINPLVWDDTAGRAVALDALVAVVSPASAESAAAAACPVT